jgi:thymidine kinase
VCSSDLAGLDQDYRGRPFEPMPQLLAIAEYITKTLAICVVCGNPANRSYRKKQRAGRVVVGGADLYEARCRRCFELGRRASPPHEPPPPGGSDEVAAHGPRPRRPRRRRPRRRVRAPR